MTVYGPRVYFEVGADGLIRNVIPPEADGMGQPVRCRFCGGIYDLGMVTVTARYSDCSMWKTPCCHRTADDREWKSLPDYERLR